MKQRRLGQYSVVPGEKAILKAKISGNVFVKAEPTVETPPNTFVCTVGNDNIVINILVTFPDSTPNSAVELTIEGEINGQPSGGPLLIDTILRTSSILDPAITLVVTK